jgi:hypothetical protein
MVVKKRAGDRIGRRDALGIIVATGAALTIGVVDAPTGPASKRGAMTILADAAMMHEQRITLREERNVVEVVDGTFNVPSTLAVQP